jgi:BMFP domain-containing protein YqiC
VRYFGAGKRPARTILECRQAFSPESRLMRLVFSDRVRYLTGMSDNSIESLARKLAESIPEGLRSMREDLEANFRGVLRSGIGKLDLVTREEFEVQEAVLARTREKLERLLAKLEEIEKS